MIAIRGQPTSHILKNPPPNIFITPQRSYIEVDLSKKTGGLFVNRDQSFPSGERPSTPSGEGGLDVVQEERIACVDGPAVFSSFVSFAPLLPFLRVSELLRRFYPLLREAGQRQPTTNTTGVVETGVVEKKVAIYRTIDATVSNRRSCGIGCVSEELRMSSIL